jgi:hypothetical protein
MCVPIERPVYVCLSDVHLEDLYLYDYVVWRVCVAVFVFSVYVYL